MLLLDIQEASEVWRKRARLFSVPEYKAHMRDSVLCDVEEQKITIA